MFFFATLAATLLTLSESYEHTPKADETVRIRGFVYESPEGHFYLADTPNLKTCCVGKKGFQLPLSGSLSASPDRVIAVEGILADDDGQRRLINVRPIEEARPFDYTVLAPLLLVIPALFWLKYRKRQQQKQGRQ